MQTRRAFLAIVTFGVVTPLTTRAQAVATIPRLCFLAPSPRQRLPWYDPFFQRLRDLGYMDGRNIHIVYLSADDRAERFPALAGECLRLKTDIIVATTTPAALAAKGATRTIPIVMLGTGDPVVTGIVNNLARPGENISGLSHMAPGLSAKRLEVLKEAVPRVSKVLVLSYLTDPIAAPQVKELQNAARSLGVKLLIHDIRTAHDLPAAFDAGAKERAEGLLTTVESIFAINRTQVIELASKHALPAIYPSRTFVDAGGLMSYGVNFPSFWAGAANYVDKILKGAKPGDLPVEQPTQFELIINMKTAKAFGLTIPQSLVERADEVIR